MHPEYGYLDSCNLVRWGTDGAEKLWLFIEPDYSKPFCDVLVKAVDDMRKKGGDVSSWLEGCAFPLHPKNLMVTQQFVKELGIQAQVVCQRPGILIYVRGGVFHQVLNTGILLSEAVNVGGSTWNVSVLQPPSTQRSVLYP